jgi:hypothetical protein
MNTQSANFAKILLPLVIAITLGGVGPSLFALLAAAQSALPMGD